MFYEDFWGRTVYGMLERMAERFGDRPLFTWKQGGAVRTVAYGDFFRDVRRLAARFDGLELRGNRVVIDMRNTYEQTAALFAAAAMGAVAAPISFDLPTEDLRDLMDRIGPGALVCDEMDLELLPQLNVPEGCRILPCLEGPDSVAAALEKGVLYQEAEDISPEDPALLLATFAVIYVCNFFIPRLMPGDPLQYSSSVSGEDMTVAYNAEQLEQLRAYYGLDQPLLTQFGRTLAANLRGDLGQSIHYKQPVSTVILSRLPWTLGLMAFSTALSLPLAVGLALL